MQGTCEKNAPILECLMHCWLKAWNECGAPDAKFSLASIFAAGENAIDVRDDAFGVEIAATSYREYKEQWLPALDHLETLVFEIVGEPEVRIAADRADVAFELTARAVDETGAPVEPKPRWRGEHVWRHIDGEWRIVRERLQAA